MTIISCVYNHAMVLAQKHAFYLHHTVSIHLHAYMYSYNSKLEALYIIANVPNVTS